jgi:hypothetical protein
MTYLGWDASPEPTTVVLTPVAAPDAAHADSWDEPIAPAPPLGEPVLAPDDAVSADAVVVTIRLPGEEGAAGGDTVVTVDAGGQATLVGLVSNQSGIVDNYDLRLDGLPEGWWSVAPPTAYLVPFGSQDGTHQQEVTIRLHPPRAPEARAGSWPIVLVATSRAQDTDVGSARATLVVAPYEAFESRLLPERARGKRAVHYDVPVRNVGNRELEVRLRGEDADGVATFDFAPPRLGVAWQEDGKSELTASARRPFTGPDRERHVTVFVESPAQTLSGAAVFIQQPWVTRRLLLAWRVVLTLAAAGLLIGGAFLAWTDQQDGLTGVCLSADASGCMRYDMYLGLAGYADAEDYAPTEPTIPDQLDGLFNFATSLGVGAIVLGVLALIGARSGTLTWLAGAVAVIGLVVFFITVDDTSGTGAWVALAGGVCALVAGILAAASRT